MLYFAPLNMERLNGLAPEAIKDLRSIVKRRKWAFLENPDQLWLFKFTGLFLHGTTINRALNQVNGRDDETRTIRDLVREKRKTTGVPLMLDLMGFGGIINDANVKGCAVAKSDQRTRARRKRDELVGNGFIKGDIRYAKTWKGIHKWLEEEEGGKRFDIIICHPLGAIRSIPPNVTFHAYAFKHLYSMLSSDDGYMFLQPNLEINTVKKYVMSLNEIPGISAVLDSVDWCFALKKSQGSPEDIISALQAAAQSKPKVVPTSHKLTLDI